MHPFQHETVRARSGAAFGALRPLRQQVRSARPWPDAVLHGHRLVHGLAVRRQGLLLHLANTASTLASEAAWSACGFRNQDDFMRERLSRRGRWFRHLLQLQKAVDRFPRLADSLCGTDGGPPLGQVAALEIARVATTDTLPQWIGEARELPLTQLRARIRSRSEAPADAVGADRRGTAGIEETAATTERLPLRLQMPPDAHLAEDILIDLFHAHVGRETGVTAFAEALVGEAVSAAWIPENTEASPRRLGVRPASEHAKPIHDRPVSCNRSGTSHGGAGSASMGIPRTPGMRRAQHTLATFDRLVQRRARLVAKLTVMDVEPSTACGEPDEPQVRALANPLRRTLAFTKRRARTIRRLVQVFSSLIRLEDQIEIDMGALLLELHESRAWRLMGCSGLEAYAERLGLGASTARARVSLARALRRLPVVHEAYRQGLVGLEATQWLARVLRDQKADASVQRRWVQHARTTTVRRMRDEQRLLRQRSLLAQMQVARRMTRRTDGQPGGPTVESARRSPPWASIPGSYKPVDDATWRASLERVPGRAREDLFALGHELAERLARGGPLLLRTRVLHLPLEVATDLRGCIRAAQVDLADHAARSLSPAEEARLRPSARMARELRQQRKALPDWLGYLALLEEAAWVWDEPCRARRQGIFERDGYRCMAPGCSARVRLQEHHVKYRSWGGGNESSNLLTLCLFHHLQGEHGSLARCRGRAPLDVTWRLGSTDLGVWYRNDKQLDAPP